MVGPEHRGEAELSARTEGRPAGDPVLAEIVRRLVDELHPQRIYLFGSRARGDARADSDYDVLLVVDQRSGEGLAMEQQAYRALRGLGVAVEVVIMTTEYFEWMLGAAASLPATVQREGYLLYAP